MSVVIAHAPTPEGAAALEHGIEEARRHGWPVAVVSRGPHRHQDPDDAADAGGGGDLAAVERRLAESGVEHSVQRLTGDYDFAERVLDAAATHAATLIVIGIRRRTPIGKLLLASSAQRILLEARCPVTAVKAQNPAG
ncbi:universal stress protein [Georgenia sp. TF02-10]|uniref:universal stress protein n=1 Tax=Georgenia sp. TF02-10 TaxID=2917725 RepID=UPI001FA6E998|nr:universal stress protein [Georgenia sp. TF02-10]UNX53713.1 universal stress protein [Georgenia sp. TF02-10]